MKRAGLYFGKVGIGLAAVCLTGALVLSSADAAPDILLGFDEDGQKIFDRYNQTPLTAMTGTDGTRNLNSYYELRRYPGAPPRIPHPVASAFAQDTEQCLSCHGRGGYDGEQEAFAPVTPHPENDACFQCHLPKVTDELFVANDWQSINPPQLGRSELAGSPPPIPHSLQLREDCIACHTGPAAVAEIRVEHGSRGYCRQCHLPMPATEPRIEFTRKTESGQ